MNRRHNEGFTLVELIIAMMTGSLVFFAAATLLLLGLRINNLTTATTLQLNNTRILNTLTERMAAEGLIEDIWFYEDDSWEVRSSNGTAFSYDAEQNAIFLGKSFQFENVEDGNPILTNVDTATIEMRDNGLLKLTVKIGDEEYPITVYCRTKMADTTVEVTEPSQPEVVDTAAIRERFVEILGGQYSLRGGAANTGVILDKDRRSTGVYYAQWYIGPDKWGQDNWTADKAAWCVCYISWALDQMRQEGYIQNPEGREHWYAYVETTRDENGQEFTGFKDYFDGSQSSGKWKNPEDEPQIGDIIFFNRDIDPEADHVGVVAAVFVNQLTGEKSISTIEGNVDGKIVTKHYPLSDKNILGYGVLPWETTP